MSPKRVEFDPKMVGKMRRRTITRQDIRWILAEGAPSPAAQYEGSEPRFAKRGYIGRRELQVIYLENAERIYVFSAHQVYSKGAHEREKKRGK